MKCGFTGPHHPQGWPSRPPRAYQHTFTVTLLLAAQAFQAHKRATHQAHSWVFGNLGADTAGFSVVVLKNGVVILRQL